ncbi:hypothetical protein IL54_1187 [Sphingobium sp. ba1]|nr:hypothetical protein IL54_1187 [Sphingobium sp. ba1]
MEQAAALQQRRGHAVLYLLRPHP